MKKSFFSIFIFVIFGIGCKAQYSVLHNFDGTDGEWPYGSVILSGKVLYGMTYYGGTMEVGNVFSVNTNGGGYKNLQ